MQRESEFCGCLKTENRLYCGQSNKTGRGGKDTDNDVLAGFQLTIEGVLLAVATMRGSISQYIPE